MMGFTFGPYLVLMVALARRLFAGGTTIESAAAPAGKPVTLRRIAGEGDVLDLNCSMPDLPSLAVWLFHPTGTAPRFYPPADCR